MCFGSPQIVCNKCGSTIITGLKSWKNSSLWEKISKSIGYLFFPYYGGPYIIVVNFICVCIFLGFLLGLIPCLLYAINDPTLGISGFIIYLVFSLIPGALPIINLISFVKQIRETE